MSIDIVWFPDYGHLMAGTFLLQTVKESDPEAGILIINAGSSLWPPTRGEFSPVKSELPPLAVLCSNCTYIVLQWNITRICVIYLIGMSAELQFFYNAYI